MINQNKIASITYIEQTDQFGKPPLRDVKARLKYYKCTLKRVWSEYYFHRALMITLNGMIPNVVKYSTWWIFYFIVEVFFTLWQGKRRKAALGTYEFKKILLIRLDHVGDLLMTTPAIRAIRQYFPNAKIDIMVGSWAADVLKNSPYIDRIYIYNLKWYNRGKRDLFQTLKNLKIRLKVLFERYDLVINFRGDNGSLLLTYLTGAPHRIATIYWDVEKFSKWKKNKYLTHGILDDNKTHYINMNLALLKVLGIYEEDRSLDLFIQREDEHIIKDYFNTEQRERTVPAIALYPGCGWSFKGWPLENFAALADWLIEEIQAQVIIVGGLNEKMKMDSMRQLMKGKPIDAVGKTTLQQLAAILRFVDLSIGNDGGVIHVAEAVKTPIICLWGPSPFEKFRPLSPYTKFVISNFECPNELCQHSEYGKKINCSNNRCMKAIPLQTVKETVIEVMSDLDLLRTRIR